MGTLIHGQAGQQVSPHAETPYGISRDISHVPACWASAHAPDPACGSRASVHVAPSLTFIQISPARHDRTVSFTSRLRTRLSPPPLQNPCLSPLALTLRPSYWATSHCAATDSAIPLHYVEGIQSGTIQAHARRIQHPVLNL